MYICGRTENEEGKEGEDGEDRTGREDRSGAMLFSEFLTWDGINRTDGVTLRYHIETNQTISINYFLNINNIVIFGNHFCDKAKVIVETILMAFQEGGLHEYKPYILVYVLITPI